MAVRWRCRSAKVGPARSRPIRQLTPSARINPLTRFSSCFSSFGRQGRASNRAIVRQAHSDCSRGRYGAPIGLRPGDLVALREMACGVRSRGVRPRRAIPVVEGASGQWREDALDRLRVQLSAARPTTDRGPRAPREPRPSPASRIAVGAYSCRSSQVPVSARLSLAGGRYETVSIAIGRSRTPRS